METHQEGPVCASPLRRGGAVLVTGGANGIGLALCAALAARGIGVVVVDRDAADLDRAVAQLAAYGVKVAGYSVDVTERAAMVALATRVFDGGGVDVVFNNAGVAGGFGPAWEVDPAEFRWVMDVNFFGVVNGVQAFVPHFVARGAGWVVNTASLAGLCPVPFNDPYNAAKQAVVGLSASLRDELAEVAPGVGVTVVCPGSVPTSLAATSRANRPHRAPRPPSRVPVSSSAHSAITPELAAARILSAVDRRQFLVATQPAVAQLARAHWAAIDRDLDVIDDSHIQVNQ